MNILSGMVNAVNAPDVSYNQAKVGQESAFSNAPSTNVDAANKTEEAVINKQYTSAINESFISYVDATTNQAIKAISNALLPVNDFTIAMTEGMIEFGKNIGKESLLTMYRDVSKFQDVAPKDLIAMKELGVELTSENVTRFEAFLNYKNIITNGLDDLVSSTVDTYEQLASEGQLDKANDFMKDIIDVFTRDEQTKPDTTWPDLVQVKEENVEIKADVSYQVANEAKKGANEEVDPTKNQMPSKNVDLAKEFPLSKTSDLPIDKALIGENVIAKGLEVPINQSLTGEVDLATNKQATGRLYGEDRVLVPDGPDTWQRMTTSIKAQLVEVLKEAGLEPGEASRLYEPEATSIDFLKQFSKVLEKKDNLHLVRDMVRDSGFSDILKDAAKSHWSLKPAQVQSKVEVESLYQRLESQVRQVTQALEKTVSENGTNNTALGKELNNMNQNFDFMNQMNHVYQYVQLPLKMAGAETTGDLFVFTDKKSLAKKDGNVSALLHLDMANLGPVDVYAAISPSGSVFTKFYLSDDNMLDFINDNIHLLNERLESRGYNAKSEMVVRGADDGNDVISNLVKDAPLRAAREKLVGKYSFDTRA